MHESLNMTEGVTQPMSDATADTGPAPARREGEPAGASCATRRRPSWWPSVMVVATYWIAGQFGEWELAGCIAGGVLLGLANHLMTEHWLLRIITSGAEPTRGQMVASTLLRLGMLTIVAVGAAVVFWPNGIGLLLGLAIFRLIALVMTGLPLLKELKQG